MEPANKAQEEAQLAWRPKKCPSCQTPVEALHLSTISTPPEQVFVPWLSMINKKVGMSLRTFGQSGLHELQLLVFTNVCEKCGHISWWDLTVEEFDALVDRKVPGVYLYWGTNPELLEKIITDLPETAGAPFKRLLETFKKDE